MKRLDDFQLRVLNALPADGWCGHGFVANRVGAESEARVLRSLGELSRRGLAESFAGLYRMTLSGKAFLKVQTLNFTEEE